LIRNRNRTSIPNQKRPTPPTQRATHRGLNQSANNSIFSDQPASHDARGLQHYPKTRPKFRAARKDTPPQQAVNRNRALEAKTAPKTAKTTPFRHSRAVM